MLTLYHGQTSVCSQKVRLVAAEVGIAYESRLIDLGKGEQFDPAYMALNPEAVVPTLVDDGRVIVESSLIAEYIDRRAGAPLMPKDFQAEVTTRLWLLRCLAIHEAINSLTFSTDGRDRTRASNTPEEIEAKLAMMPNPQMAAKRRDLLALGTGSVFVAGALHTIDRMLTDMAEALRAGPWLTGAHGLADVVLLAYVDRLERLGMDGLWRGRHDGIADWLAASQDRPSYAVAISSHIPPTGAASSREVGERHWPAIAARLAGI